jgi:hypothetical protein
MKVNLYFLIFSVMLGFLIGFTSFSFAKNDFIWVFSILAGAEALIYALFLFALSPADTRKGINIRVVSVLFILVHVLKLLIFSNSFTCTFFIIISAFQTLFYLGILALLLKKLKY